MISLLCFLFRMCLYHASLSGLRLSYTWYYTRDGVLTRGPRSGLSLPTAPKLVSPITSTTPRMGSVECSHSHGFCFCILRDADG
ncbi:uncharacterized protein B0H64DRAFT_403595 [Chaetomium fimeti]|uniref:Secreted protein n=1 Tax=Chaetomium fimeti TaxID=1854472 RepID=A0AAE0HAX3_9PEZI|nr:hypothetical protein B0H64DRAFT_403595 [Chaetomium fimeti]